MHGVTRSTMHWDCSGQHVALSSSPLLATLGHRQLGGCGGWPGHVSLAVGPQTQLLLPALQAPLLAEQSKGRTPQRSLGLTLLDLPYCQRQLRILCQVAVLHGTQWSIITYNPPGIALSKTRMKLLPGYGH